MRVCVLCLILALSWLWHFLIILACCFVNVVNAEKSIKKYKLSYVNVHVLLNLLNELRKSDKMRGLLRILSLFRNEFNKLNNTRA